MTVLRWRDKKENQVEIYSGDLTFQLSVFKFACNYSYILNHQSGIYYLDNVWNYEMNNLHMNVVESTKQFSSIEFCVPHAEDEGEYYTVKTD